MPLSTAAGLDAWLASHPGSTPADFATEKQIEDSFAALTGGTNTAAGYVPPGAIPSLPVGPPKGGISLKFASGAGSGVGGVVGGVIGSVVPGIGTAIGGLIGGMLGGLFGGGPSTPTQADQVISVFRSDFPDQNSPICNTPIDVSSLGGGGPVWLNIPCDDPNLGDASRSTLEWWIKKYGVGTFLSAVQGLLSPSPTGHPSFAEQASQASSGAESEVENEVNNFTAVNNIDTSPIGAAINSGINNVVTAVTNAEQTATQAITDQVNGFANSLFGWAKSVGQWLADNIGSALSAIASHLKDVAGAVYNTVKDAVVTVVDKIASTVGPVIASIAQDIGKVVQFYQDHIAPILTTISQIERTVATAITAIEKDINSGIKGLLQLPSDLANALSSIDQALIRAGQALRVKKKADADVYFYGDEPDGFAAHIKNLGSAVAGLGGKVSKTTYNPGTETFTEPTLATVIPELLQAFNAIVGDLAGAVKNLWNKPELGAEALGLAGAGILFDMIEPIELLYMLFEVLKVPMEALGETAAERVREKTLLAKLDPQTLAAAWRRGLVTSTTMDEEGATQGYGPDRMELLRRLTTYVEAAETLVDYRYRGIVSDDDLSSGLSVLGFTPEQQSAYLQGSLRLLDVSTAVQAYRRSEIDDTQLDQVLQVNRFNDADRQLLKVLAIGPTNPDAYLKAHLIHTVLDDWGIARPTINEVQQDVRFAARAAGWDDDAIVAWFTNGIQTLPAVDWLNLYWRGQASAQQLAIALERDRVPQTFIPNWIDSQRPLIPFRTIPSMITAGIVSQADGLRMLQEHGYSLENAVLLIKYATRGAKSTKAVAASATHGTSMATARQAFDDGLIDADQYTALLKAHGLDDAGAALEVSMAKLTQEVKSRKQTGTDIVNEFKAGLIDLATATQRLATAGFTLAEQAAFQKELKAAGATKGKMPSEAELRALTKADIISADEYETTLVQIGFAAYWAARFRQLHFPPTSTLVPGVGLQTLPATGG